MGQNTGIAAGARMLRGQSGDFASTLVPIEMLQACIRETALPITITGASQITFTLAASSSKPVYVWAGDDFWRVDASVAYTWVTGAVNTTLSSAGVITASQSAATGVWYFYLTVDTTGSGTFKLYPSQTAPAWNANLAGNPLQGGFLGHPGATVTQPLIYVGFQVCTSASGAGTYAAMTKIGFTYNYIPDTTFHTNTATSTIAASTDCSTFLPKHGITVGGIMSTSNSASDAVFIAQDASKTGQILLTTAASATATQGFSGFPINGSATVFLGYTGHSASTDVQFTQFVDVV